MFRSLHILFFPLVICCSIILLFSYSAVPAFSQQSKTSDEHSRTIDSRPSLLKKEKDDTNKVNTLDKLSEQFWRIGKYDSAFQYADSALQLAKRLNFQKGIATAYNNIGTIYTYQDDYEKAIENYFAAIKIQKETGDKQGIAASYNNIGNIYYKQGNYDKALEKYFASLKIKEELLPTAKNPDIYRKLKLGIAASYGNIGNIYYEQDNSRLDKKIQWTQYDKALENYFTALKILEEMDNQQGIALLYNNIGLIYHGQCNYSKALENHFASLKIREEIGNKQGIAASHNNIGNIYYEQKNYNKALENHFTALKIFKEMDDPQGITVSCNNIGNVYGKLNQPVKAIEYYSKALSLAKEIGNEEDIKESYQNLSEIYADRNDYKNAYQYHLLYSQINDSIFNKESSKQISELQTKYETGKKEKKIELLSKEKAIQTLRVSQQELTLSRQKIFIFIIISASVFLLGTGSLLYSRYKIKQKEQMKTLLLRQQQQNTRAIIEAQEQERKRIARELHDGIGQTLAGIKIGFEKLSDEFHLLSAKKQASALGMISSLDEAYKEARTLSHQMLPRALKEMNLENAISELLERTLPSAEIKYTFEHHNTAPIPQQAAFCLYRVLQELLNNILKHAQAKNILAQLLTTGENIIMLVQDDGVGIETDKISNGIGLKNISGRVQVLNGTFSITKEEQGGTLAAIRIPLQKENIS